MSPLTKNISNYLEFLSSLYNEGSSYSTVNTARSALSTIFGNIDGVPLGEHKLIVDLMKGISRLRPVKPRYNVTWNPDVVLKYLRGIVTETCSLKDLTLKLVSLLALCTGQRVQTLSNILLSNIHCDDSVQITISSYLKTTTVVKSNRVLLLPPFHVSQLCPVVALKEYVKRTKLMRSECDSLLISYVKPHHKVSSQTISRW